MTDTLQDLIKKAADLAAAQKGKIERNYLKHSTQGIATIVSNELNPQTALGPAFFTQLRIDTSEPAFPGAVVDEVGAVRDHPIFLDKFKGDNFKAMVKFIKTALNETGPVSAEEFTEVLNEVRSSKQPLRGLKVRYEVSGLKKSQAGKFYSVTKFFPVLDQTAESVEANRKSLDEMESKK